MQIRIGWLRNATINAVFFLCFYFVEGFDKMSSRWLIANVTMIMKRFDC